MPVLALTIPGNPHPKERPRVYRGRAITPPKTQAAEAVIAHAARQHLREPADHPVQITLNFRRKDKIRCDLDNLAKTVLDALNGIAYTDDHLVHQLTATVERGSSNPGTDILVEYL